MEREQYALMDALEGDLWWYRALHADLHDALAALALPRDAAVLDAGCGTGGLLRGLERTAPGWTLVGVEREPVALALARRKTRATLVHGSIDALPFPPDRFHAIVSADVLYHAGVDEPAALAECLRCLRPGGRLVLNLPAYEWMRSGHDAHVHGARRYRASGLRRRLAAAGFVDLRVGYRNSLLFPLMAAHRLTSGRRAAASDVRPLPRWLDALLFGATRVERTLRRASLRLPLGGSVFAVAAKA